MLAAATSFFSRTVISQSYNVGNIGSRPTSPGSSGSQAPAAPFVPTLLVGLWKVQPAYHKITNKRVSVWTCDKRGPDMDRSGTLARERMIEVLKAEVCCFNLGV
jgi:SCY1-like protein 2